MTREDFIAKHGYEKNIDLKDFVFKLSEMRSDLDELLKQEAIEFVNGLRDYERESGTSLLDDERQHDRTTEELYEIYKDSQSKKL